MTTRAEWMKRAQAVNKAKGSPPATFIESNLSDLKGQTITRRVMKDDWGGNSGITQKVMDQIVNEIANRPDMSGMDIGSGPSNGFTPAGTTTGKDPSRIAKLRKKSGNIVPRR